MTPFLPEFEYFLTLCETLNISRAAENLNMGQGSLSKALKKLELSMQGELFIRQGRGLKQTELGYRVQRQILEMKDSWEQGLQESREELETVAGRYLIGAHQSVAIDSFPSVLPMAMEKYPQLEIDFILKSSGEVTRGVIDHEIDLGIVANPIQHPNLVIKKLRKEYVGLWSRKLNDHEQVIYYSPEMIGLNKVLNRYKDYKHIPITNYELLAALGAKGNGIFVLPNPVAERFKHLKLVGKREFSVDICLISHVDRPKTKGFTTLLQLFKEDQS